MFLQTFYSFILQHFCSIVNDYAYSPHVLSLFLQRKTSSIKINQILYFLFVTCYVLIYFNFLKFSLKMFLKCFLKCFMKSIILQFLLLLLVSLMGIELHLLCYHCLLRIVRIYLFQVPNQKLVAYHIA
jgi:hypothetical protein